MRRLRFAFKHYFVFLAIYCFFNQLAVADNNPVASKYILYDVNLSKQRILKDDLKDEAFENFVGLIHFLPKKDPSNFLNEKLELIFEKKLDGVFDGWKVLNKGEWLSPPKTNKSAFTDIELAPSRWRLPKSLYGFNEIWIDYQSVYPYELCKPSIELTGDYQGFGRPLTSKSWIENSSSFSEAEVIKTFNFQGNAYAKKNIIYYLRKFFHLLSSSVWYFESGNNVLLMEKIIHEDLRDVDYLDIEIPSNLKVNDIQLFFDNTKGISNGKALSVPRVLIDKNPNSTHSTYRYSIRAALEERYPDSFYAWKDAAGKQSYIYLQRIVFVVSETEENLVGVDLIKSANFIGSSHNLPERKWQPNIRSFRQVISLNNIAEPYRSEVILKKALLRLRADKFQQCAIKIKEIGLVKTYQGNVPRYLQIIEDWNHHLGGPQKASDDLSQGEVEYPENLLYFPVNSLIGTDRNNQWNGSFLESDSYQKEGTLDSLLTFPNEDVLYASNGANLKTIDGKFQITWPIKANIKKGSKFFIGGLPSSLSENILSVEIKSSNGEVLNLKTIKVNQAEDFPDSIKSIRSFKVVGLLGKNAELPILDMAIFYPGIVDYKKALMLKLPTMMASNSSTKLDGSHADLGVRKSVLNMDQISAHIKFRSIFDSPLRDIYGLRVNFLLPNSAGTPEGCALNARLNFEMGTLQRNICINITATSQYFAFNELIGDHQNIDLGKLISVDWQINKSLFNSRAELEKFRLNIVAYGWGERSVLDRIVERPLASINETPIYIDKSLFKNEIQSMGFDRRMWTSIFAFTPVRLGQNIVTFDDMHDPWIALEKLAVMHPANYFRGEVVGNLQTKNSLNLTFYVVLIVGFILMLCVLWKRWSIIKSSVCSIFGWFNVEFKDKYFVAKILSFLRLVFISQKFAVYRMIFFAMACLPLFYFGINRKYSELGGWYLSFAELFSAFTLRELIIGIRSNIYDRYPTIACQIYETRGNVDFFGALFIFPIITMAMLLSLDIASQELASIAYLMLVFGVLSRIFEKK